MSTRVLPPTGGTPAPTGHFHDLNRRLLSLQFPFNRESTTTKVSSFARRRCVRLVSTAVLCAASALALTASSFDGLAVGKSFATAAFDAAWDHQSASIAIDGQPAIDQDRVTSAHAPVVAPPRRPLPSFALDRGAAAVLPEPVQCAARPLDRHTISAPLSDDDDSSDGDDDDDDDDDDIRTERGDTAAPANVDVVSATCEDDVHPICTLPTLDAILPISFISDVQSLRAPPR